MPILSAANNLLQHEHNAGKDAVSDAYNIARHLSLLVLDCSACHHAPTPSCYNLYTRYRRYWTTRTVERVKRTPPAMTL